ncbi:MAG TPA: sarcosine oxidase subunit gamma family protein [Aliidongia sp.]|uniref:sarcosine oxidase subunit gamma n=1 Tax=Aliidongia sp. TaxID=1914230 RepID=UPI002DDCB6AF|nr:sarcosine oxidase subunit gamma family protein [Aliidongia sp.]HEV2677417.1 sarcosine oxidase subunit gamma family protein [Aliidongia sp.]
MPDLLGHIAQTRIVPAGRYGANDQGVTVTLVEGVCFASIATAWNRTEGLNARCAAAFGTALPTGPKRVAASGLAFIGMGPGRWLAAGFTIGDLEGRLRDAFQVDAAVCDQSDAYVLFAVSGENARAALAKLIPIDLDPSAFRPDDAATTSAATIGVTLWQESPAPVFHLAVGRSFAPSFSRALVMSAAEFGCAIVG